ncbi:MAG: hypothetical protein KAS71_19360 [Bacteroidales bacterium]|nr:hypothetical protein [Bacteroidales bacterium]
MSKYLFPILLFVFIFNVLPAQEKSSDTNISGHVVCAGTINLILRDPVNNNYEFGFQNGVTGYWCWLSETQLMEASANQKLMVELVPIFGVAGRPNN